MKISAVVPSFNQGKYIADCLYSLSHQDVDIEILVLDGGSTDNTLEIIQKYRRIIHWYRSERDGGQAQAVNEGIRRASGEIICWLNSDDLLAEGALKSVLEVFSTRSDVDMVAGSAFWVSEDLQDIAFWPKLQRLCLEDFSRGYPLFAQPSVFFRREAWERVGGLDESLHFTLDYDLFIRCLRDGLRVHLLDRPLSVNRVQPNAKSLDPRMLGALYKTACQHFPNAPKQAPKRFWDAFGWRLLKIFPASFLAGLVYRRIRPSPTGLPGGLVPRRWVELAAEIRAFPQRRQAYETKFYT